MAIAACDQHRLLRLLLFCVVFCVVCVRIVLIDPLYIAIAFSYRWCAVIDPSASSCNYIHTVQQEGLRSRVRHARDVVICIVDPHLLCAYASSTDRACRRGHVSMLYADLRLLLTHVYVLPSSR